ncbi:MAG: Ig-like domain repeat protein [Terriglobales bacterium]
MAAQTDGNPADPTFVGGLQGGFFLQSNGSVTGQTVYSIASSTSITGACNSGSAPVTVTISGQNVTLTEVAGTQTFTLTGTLASNGSTMMGTYTSTAGTAADGSPCGYAETGLSWSAVSVPPLTGSISGSFHSGGTGDDSGLLNQDFPVTGSLMQGPNIGASNATVTGSLSFMNPLTGSSDYPCIPSGVVYVNGQISGNSVILQLIDVNGSNDGQIGIPLSQASTNGGLETVTLNSTTNGYALQSQGQGYVVNTKYCPNNSGGDFEDLGYVCLGLNSQSACQEPITLFPEEITFPAQVLGTSPTQQIITLANNSGAPLSGLTLTFSDNNTYMFGGESDFDNLPNFSETDACGAGGTASGGQPFGLSVGQSCPITVTFSPQESCPWIPFGSPPSAAGVSPEYCPFAIPGIQVEVSSQSSADHDTSFVVAISGTGLSAITPTTHELDFSAEEQSYPPEASVPQMLIFTNNSTNPVQILGRASCTNPPKGPLTLPAPRQEAPVAGLLVVGTQPGVNNGILAVLPSGGNPPTITYNCDSDPVSKQSNFQISSDTCTGALLAPQTSCSVEVTYAPQPDTSIAGGLDYFLELNTLQCWPAGTLPSDSNPCEIDSGRFAVELRSNPPSPLRLLPSAGLDFGNQAVGKKSAAQTITLLNDPNLATTETVTFVGKIQVSGSYSESDDCPASLAPGASCTLTVNFKPGSVGFTPGNLTINYSPEPTGAPQLVRLRGTGLSAVGTATTTTLSSSLNPSQSGQSVTFTAVVSYSGGTPPDGEIVTFGDGDTLLGTATLSNGTAIFTTSTLPAGSNTITVVYGGDQNLSGSSSTLVQTVN